MFKKETQQHITWLSVVEGLQASAFSASGTLLTYTVSSIIETTSAFIVSTRSQYVRQKDSSEVCLGTSRNRKLRNFGSTCYKGQCQLLKLHNKNSHRSSSVPAALRLRTQCALRGHVLPTQGSLEQRPLAVQQWTAPGP